MIEIIKRNRFFIIPYLLFLSIASYFLLAYSKSEIHIYLNQYHSSATDLFFRYLTDLGDGLAVAVFLLILLFISYRYFLIMAANVFLTTFVVQGFKRIIFKGMSRPFNYFSGTYELHLIPGVDMHSFNSFPSGHSASAFGIFFMAALITKNNSLKFIFFVIALLTAYSRVYLSQHFLTDIYFGSLISSVFTFIMFYFGMKWQKKALDNSLITLYSTRK